MTCCKLSENDTVRDFILNSQAPIYTAIKLTEMYREEALRLKDKSQDFTEIAEYCEVSIHLYHLHKTSSPLGVARWMSYTGS